MVASLSSHPMLNPASNGICNPSANPTTALQITSAPCVDPRTIHSPLKNASDFSKIVTPYNADEFNTLLHCYNLTSQYPTLSLDLCTGFPLREFDRLLLNSYDHPNHKNAFPHINEIFSYIQDEVAFGWMSGPFSWDKLKKRGPR